MGQKEETVVNGKGMYTKEEESLIDGIYQRIFLWFIKADIPPHIFSCALMLATAKLVALSTDSEEYIVESFRQCLRQEREEEKVDG